MKAVENVPAAVAQYAMMPDAQESPGGGVVVEDGDVLVHQEHIRRNSIQQLAEQDFVAHLCDWDTHVGRLFTFWVDCQHHSAQDNQKRQATPNRVNDGVPPHLV